MKPAGRLKLDTMQMLGHAEAVFAVKLRWCICIDASEGSGHVWQYSTLVGYHKHAVHVPGSLQQHLNGKIYNNYNSIN
jgi:hypothetical protein